MGFPSCVECGSITSRYGTKRCIKCHKIYSRKFPFLKGKKFTEIHKKNISLSKSGKKHPCWKGGIIQNSRGYLIKYSKRHPYQDCNGYVRLHRLVMEKHLGRYLHPREIVHHINGDKLDNRIENLKVMTNSSHALYHRRLQLISY